MARCGCGAGSKLAGLLGACGLCVSVAQAAAEQAFFGIRLGAALQHQLAQCPAPDARWTAADAPCRRRASSGERSVALPRALQALAPSLEVRRITEADGLVVEVEAQFRPEEAVRVAQHLRAAFGAPAEVDVDERHSRVGGLSRHRSLSWKSGGMTVHLLELAASDQGSVRAFLDRWADAQAEHERAQRATEAQAIEHRSKALREQLASPLAALDRALSAQDAAQVRALLDRRIDLSASTASGSTVLHTAAALWGDVAILRLLVDAGAAVDALDDQGRTPLIAALESPHHLDGDSGRARLIAMSDFLMSRGADLGLRDRQGRTPVSTALRTQGMLPLAEHLFNRGLPLPADALIGALQGGAVDADLRRHPALLAKAGREHVLARDAAGQRALDIVLQSERFASRSDAEKLDIVTLLGGSGSDLSRRRR